MKEGEERRLLQPYTKEMLDMAQRAAIWRPENIQTLLREVGCPQGSVDETLGQVWLMGLTSIVEVGTNKPQQLADLSLDEWPELVGPNERGPRQAAPWVARWARFVLDRYTEQSRRAEVAAPMGNWTREQMRADLEAIHCPPNSIKDVISQIWLMGLTAICRVAEDGEQALAESLRQWPGLVGPNEQCPRQTAPHVFRWAREALRRYTEQSRRDVAVRTARRKGS
jgi:hypothetical protein